VITTTPIEHLKAFSSGCPIWPRQRDNARKGSKEDCDVAGLLIEDKRDVRFIYCKYTEKLVYESSKVDANSKATHNYNLKPYTLIAVF
jgi:hypothetical protein